MPRYPMPGLLALGILLGISVWQFSPWLTGKAEPWDSDLPIWTFSWILVAILGGIVGHVRGVCVPLGYGLGQMLATIQFGLVGQFGFHGWLFIAGYMGIAGAVSLGLMGAMTLIKRHCRTRS